MPPPPISVPSFVEPSVQMARSYQLQSLASFCSVHTLSFSASFNLASSTSKTWFSVCSQGGVLSCCMDQKIDLQALLAVFLQLTFVC